MHMLTVNVSQASRDIATLASSFLRLLETAQQGLVSSTFTSTADELCSLVLTSSQQTQGQVAFSVAAVPLHVKCTVRGESSTWQSFLKQMCTGHSPLHRAQPLRCSGAARWV